MRSEPTGNRRQLTRYLEDQPVRPKKPRTITPTGAASPNGHSALARHYLGAGLPTGRTVAVLVLESRLARAPLVAADLRSRPPGLGRQLRHRFVTPFMGLELVLPTSEVLAPAAHPFLGRRDLPVSLIVTEDLAPRCRSGA